MPLKTARVEEALEQPGRCYACFLSRMEVLYRVWKDEDERAGRLAYEQLKARHSPLVG